MRSGRGMTIGVLGALILVVVALVAWRGGFSLGSSSDQAANPSGQTTSLDPTDPPAVTQASADIMSANAIYREFQDNAVDATNRYEGRSVNLEGLRGDLVLISDGVQAAVHIADRAKPNALILTFPDRNLVRGIERGERFRFRCTVDKYEFGIVWMDDCSIER